MASMVDSSASMATSWERNRHIAAVPANQYQHVPGASILGRETEDPDSFSPGSGDTTFAAMHLA
jgi:hypothetical protein